MSSGFLSKLTSCNELSALCLINEYTYVVEMCHGFFNDHEPVAQQFAKMLEATALQSITLKRSSAAAASAASASSDDAVSKRCTNVKFILIDSDTSHALAVTKFKRHTLIVFRLEVGLLVCVFDGVRPPDALKFVMNVTEGVRCWS
jgi:hypothetical protein